MRYENEFIPVSYEIVRTLPCRHCFSTHGLISFVLRARHACGPSCWQKCWPIGDGRSPYDCGNGRECNSGGVIWDQQQRAKKTHHHQNERATRLVLYYMGAECGHPAFPTPSVPPPDQIAACFPAAANGQRRACPMRRSLGGSSPVATTHPPIPLALILLSLEKITDRSRHTRRMGALARDQSPHSGR